MKENITFVQSEEKSTLDGKLFVRFKDSNGRWISVFDETMIQDLLANLNVSLEVELATNAKGYTNIKKIYGVASLSDIRPPKTVTPSDYEKVKQTTNYNNSNTAPLSMWVSYAKDLVIAGKTPFEAADIICELRDLLT